LFSSIYNPHTSRLAYLIFRDVTLNLRSGERDIRAGRSEQYSGVCFHTRKAALTSPPSLLALYFGSIQPAPLAFDDPSETRGSSILQEGCDVSDSVPSFVTTFTEAHDEKFTRRPTLTREPLLKTGINSIHLNEISMDATQEVLKVTHSPFIWCSLSLSSRLGRHWSEAQPNLDVDLTSKQSIALTLLGLATKVGTQRWLPFRS